MGIPRLTTTLRPLAEQCPLNDAQVVVDGPGLAFHILRDCQRRATTDTIFNIPTYEQLGQAAVSFLDGFGSEGITVSAIFFDGYLPDHKRPTRMSRFFNQSKDLNKYFLSSQMGVKVTKPGGISSHSLDLLPQPSQYSRALQPPFVVPAVFEALKQSHQYRDITRLIPGEADPYLAEFVRVHGGVVMTSDSDLLVFDLGPNGAVVFFDDIEVRRHTDLSTLLVPKFSPRQISQKLSLPPENGLSLLAFQLATDSHLPLKKLTKRANRTIDISSQTDEYQEFTTQYPNNLTQCPSIACPPPTFDKCAFDARISEVVLQCYSPTGEGGPILFLPQLLDSWSRSSAWEVSTPSRKLAYSFLQYLTKARLPTVVEHRRLLSISSSGKSVSVPLLPSLETMCTSALALQNRIRQGLTNPDYQWIVLSMFQDLTWSSEEAKESVVLKVLHNETGLDGTLDSTSWDVVHWLAQLQGTCYSLRILQQILSFVKLESDSLPVAATELLEALSTLPPLAGYPTMKDMQTLPGRIREAGGLSLLSSLCSTTEPIQIGTRLTRKRMRKREHGDGDMSGRQKVSPTLISSNPFAVLPSEDAAANNR